MYTLMYMKEATRTQIYLTAEQRRRIDERAKREGTTMAEVVRDAVDAYVRKPSRAEVQAIIDSTFGALPKLKVPSRDEWDRPTPRHRRPRR
jgi:hypothetical protein